MRPHHDADVRWLRDRLMFVGFGVGLLLLTAVSGTAYQ